MYGVVIWKAELGSEVTQGQVVAEIVDVEHPEAGRTQLRSRTTGVLFARCLTHWVQAGQTVAKVAGPSPLQWRTGSLLTV